MPKGFVKTITPRAQRFLDLTALHWAEFNAEDTSRPGMGVIQRLCALVPCSVGIVSQWRKGLPEFRERERLAREASVGKKYRAKELPSWAVQRFFEILEATDDRMEACKEIGARWSEVETAIASEEGFRRRMEDYETEWKIRAEDVLRKDVSDGDRAAARAYLGAHDERYMPGKKGRPAKGAEASQSPAERASEALDWLDSVLGDDVN